MPQKILLPESNNVRVFRLRILNHKVRNDAISLPHSSSTRNIEAALNGSFRSLYIYLFSRYLLSTSKICEPVVDELRLEREITLGV